MEDVILTMLICLLLCRGLLFGADTSDDHVRKADRLHAQGHFDDARREYEAAARSAGSGHHILERLGFIHFLKAEYAEAAQYFREVVGLNPDRRRLMLAYTAFAYHHMQRYSDVVEILEELGTLNLLNCEQMRLLAKEEPYRIDRQWDWTALPFLQVDPLPVVQVHVNSASLSVIVDTGAGQLVIDPAVAAEVGIRAVSKQPTRGFAGGKTAVVSFGMARSMSLGSVTIGNVPVWILPTRRFSSDFGRTIDGVLGTEVLMRFIPRLDYPNSRLILLPKSEAGAVGSMTRQVKARVPFVIDGLHSMYAQCLIDGTGPVLMYFDSGLADDEGASLVLNDAALAGLRIQKPPMTEHGVGGGGAFKYGYIRLDSVRVSTLIMHRPRAAYSSGSGDGLTPSGYTTYGALSHHFLRRYRWTIDFGRRVFVFD